MNENQKNQEQATSLLPEGWQAAQAVDLQTLVRHQLEQITKEYLEHYGCNSCWSDAHQCTCSHDKYVIMAFVDNLKSKIKKDV